MRRYKETHKGFDGFGDKVVFQLNDTHPTMAVPELMRLLMDEQGLGWTKSWDICSKVHSFRVQGAECRVQGWTDSWDICSKVLSLWESHIGERSGPECGTSASKLLSKQGPGFKAGPSPGTSAPRCSACGNHT